MLSLVFSSIRRSQHLFHFQFKHFHTPGRHFHFISSLVCLPLFNAVRLRFRGGFSRNNIRFLSRCTCSNSALRRPKVRKPRKSPQKDPYKSPHKTPESHHIITSKLRHPRKSPHKNPRRSPHKNPRRSPHRKSPPESKEKGSAHFYYLCNRCVRYFFSFRINIEYYFFNHLLSFHSVAPSLRRFPAVRRLSLRVPSDGAFHFRRFDLAIRRAHLFADSQTKSKTTKY